MVRVAIAGGTGNVSTELVYILGQSGRHEIEVLTRSKPLEQNVKGVTFVQVDYNNKKDLAEKLTGVHTLLCFISNIDLQKSLIDTCVEVGVKRYAPNEWAARSYNGSFTYHEKDEVYGYLKEINQETKVLEYCLFQPGLFTNYLSSPLPSTTYHPIYTNMFDIQNRRALVPEQGDYRITMTTIQDLALVIDEALAFEGAWPVIGGISGSTTTSSEIIKMAESIRGPFEIIKISQANLEAGKLGVNWDTRLKKPPHLDVGQDWETFTHYVVAEIMRGALKGTWEVSNEWNKLLPHVQLTTVEEFLVKIWKE